MIKQDKFTVQGKPVQNKEEALSALCATANANCLPITQLWCYEELCEMFDITPDDYWNDENELSEEHKDIAGNNNWKPTVKIKNS
jgi:hypothetical protein